MPNAQQLRPVADLDAWIQAADSAATWLAS
jgi:hypothetical protein